MCADQAGASRDHSSETSNSDWGGPAGAQEQGSAPTRASSDVSPAEIDGGDRGEPRAWTLGLNALFALVVLGAMATALRRMIDQGVSWRHLGLATCFWIGMTGALLVASRRDRRRHNAPGTGRPVANHKSAQETNCT